MAGMVMRFMVVVLMVMVAAPAAYATSYIVGGSSRWDEGLDYTGWASGKRFKVNDTLVFVYGPNHGVDIVNAEDYTNCFSSSPINSYSGGATTITLSASGEWYFICPTDGHCANGQALFITVEGAKTPSPPGVIASPPPPVSTTTPPPPSTTTATNGQGRRAGGRILSSLICVVFVVLMSV